MKGDDVYESLLSGAKSEGSRMCLRPYCLFFTNKHPTLPTSHALQIASATHRRTRATNLTYACFFYSNEDLSDYLLRLVGRTSHRPSNEDTHC